MNIKPNQKTTKLGTDLIFGIVDVRGSAGFPNDQRGFVFIHIEDRTIQCKNTGLPIHRKARYHIRTAADESGWRIDLSPVYGPLETVYGLGEGRPTHWTTAKQAAQALSEVLDEIERNSSLGG